MGAITDKLIKQSNGTQPLPTTLSAQKSAGATTASLNAATGWDTTTAKHIRMYKTKVVNTQTVPDWDYVCFYKGTLSGTTLSDLTLVWSSTGSDQTFAIGDTVDLSYTSGWGEDLYSALSTHLDQDGTLKADSVDVTAVIKDGIVTNAKLVNDTVEIGKLHEKTSEYISDFVASGGTVAQSAGLTGTFSNIVYYISGVRYSATSIANKTYTASKDTYVDIGTDGVVDCNEVANGAASPALSSGHIRIAKVVTNGSAITSVTQLGPDSLGNHIYNKTPVLTRGVPVLARQGGSSTVWATDGINGYNTTGVGAFIQAGTIAAGASPQVITFPVPFTYAPIITATTKAYTANCYCTLSSITSTGFSVQVLTDAGAGNNSQGVNWIAIGV